MASINRSRFIVDLNNAWHIHTTPVDGCKMIGTIQRKLQIDALAKDEEGFLAVKNGRIERLNPRKVQAAIDQLKLATHQAQSPS
jgi:hypothetical protein